MTSLVLNNRALFAFLEKEDLPPKLGELLLEEFAVRVLKVGHPLRRVMELR